MFRLDIYLLWFAKILLSKFVSWQAWNTYGLNSEVDQ